MTEEEDISSDATLAALIKDFAARWRMPVTVRVEGDIEALNDATVEAAYAIASEALANAAKHSGAPGATRCVGDRRRHAPHGGAGPRARHVAVPDDDPHFGIRD